MNNTAKCECLSNIVYKAWMLHILGYSVYRQTKQIKSDYYPLLPLITLYSSPSSFHNPQPFSKALTLRRHLMIYLDRIGYKDTRIQGFRNTRIQGYKDTRIQGYKDTRIQLHFIHKINKYTVNYCRLQTTERCKLRYTVNYCTL